MDSGKDVSILANDVVYVDQNTANVQSPSSDNVANLSDLQKAILAGKDLTQLEETAAGDGDAGSGEGASLGEAKFAEGGHESNIYAYNKNIDDNNYAFAAPAHSVGTAANNNNGNSEDTIVLDASVSLTLELKTADGNDNIITEK